jgi:hypothetical protein
MSAGKPDMQAARRLIDEVIDSFEKLEIVVHLHRLDFAATPAPEIAKALSLPGDEVDRALQDLDRERVLERNGPWRAAVDALVQMYDTDRIEVLRLMTKTALERVRKHAARVFADAFVLRPKKKGDPDA